MPVDLVYTVVARRALFCLVVLAAAGCGGSETPSEPAASLDCAYPLVWDETRYEVGIDLPKTSELGPSLGTGVVLGCGDEQSGYYPDEDVDVRSVEGVDPAIAVAALLEGSPRSIVWLAPGFLVESPRHPLHEAIAPAWAMDGFEDFSCEETFTTTARALATPPGQGLEIEADDPAVEALLVAPGAHRSVAVDAETAISGLERLGAPYVQQGDEFELAVSACDSESESESDPTLGGPLLLAESLSER